MAMKKPMKKAASKKKASSASGSDRGAQMKADAAQKKKQDKAKAAKARTDAERFKKIKGATRAEIEGNPYRGYKGMAWEKNATSKNTNIPKGIIAMLKSNDNMPYRDRNEKLMVRGKYKGAGSKPKGKK